MTGSFLRLFGRGASCVLVALSMALAQASNALAEDSAAEGVSTRTHVSWQSVSVADPAQCFATQTVLSRSNQSFLLQVVLVPEEKAEDGAALWVKVPTGAFLQDGIAYRYPPPSRRAVGLAWQSCDAERCSSQVQISGDELQRLKRGREIIVGFRPLPNSLVLNVPVSLMGLTSALAAVDACRAASK